ncbi:MAG: TIGR03936 family radical SAM-associated protein [Eubacteriaceae bacterium]|nr:TIGR03936 family radical SAM-associated protein [Eubacteriaceae bacterium]
MTVMRFKFSRGEELQYLSHLDQQRVFQRAFRRAEIPMAFSNGFNPHPRISFAQAMPVGMTSDEEYGDVILTDEMTPVHFVEKVNYVMPKGLKIKKAWLIQSAHSSLSASVECAVYKIKIESEESFQRLQTTLEKYKTLNTIIVQKRNKRKKMVDIDIRPFIENFSVDSLDLGIASFELTIRFIHQQSIKPILVMQSFKKLYKLNLNFEQCFQVHRKVLQMGDLI